MKEKRPQKGRAASIVFTGAVLSFIMGAAALGFGPWINRENRAQLILWASLFLIGCVVVLTILQRFVYWQAERGAVKRFSRTQRDSHHPASAHLLTPYLSEGALRHLAIQVFSQQGYRVSQEIDHNSGETWIRLVNPQSQVEVLICRQQAEPVGMPAVRKLRVWMHQERAVRGHLWAPGGFTQAARYWSRSLPIVFTDKDQIGMLVDQSLTAQGQWKQSYSPP